MEHETFPQSVRETAAQWHERLRREKVSEETRAAFAAWIAESPDHPRTYDSVHECWTRLQGLGAEPEILALRHETALRLTRGASSRIRPLRWAVAAVLVLAMGAAGVRLLGSIGMGGSDRYSTGTGERLAVSLADGSQLTLDTQSELRVAFTQAERLVRLTRGQAFFEVARDPEHPFVVEVGNHRFVAVGTAFDVRVDGEQVKITMVEGAVRVERRDRNPKTITAGEQLVADGSRQERVRTTDPERSTSWRRGQIIFESTRLADAIAELNRYSRAKIELADPALGDLRLSGAFATGRPTSFVEAVTTYFPIQVDHTDERTVVLSARR